MKHKDLAKGVAIGIGVAVMTPLVIAALAPVVKPVARSALKAGVRIYEKGREQLEVINETLEDVTAEVEEEMMDARNNEEPEIVENPAEDPGKTESDPFEGVTNNARH